MKPFLQPIAIAILFLATSMPVVRSFEFHQLYLPHPQELTTPKAYHWPYEDIWLTTSDGKPLHGWWIPSTDTRAPVMLMCHGQGGNISDRLPKVALWRKLGASVFLIDYRGYGRSGGSPSEEGLYKDGDAAYLWVQKRFQEQRIFIYGTSLGGGVATEMAVRHPTATGLILEDTFTSIEDMARYRYAKLPVDWLVSESFDNQEKIPKITMPVMIFHSKDDEKVPFEMGRALYDAAPKPKYFVQLSGPHDAAYSICSAVYTAALSRFLQNPI